MGASRERRSSCRGRVSSTERLGTKCLEGGKGQGKGEQSGSASETRSGAHSMVCDHPPEIRHEPAEHIEAPDMGAGGSHPHSEIMQHSPSASVSSSRQQGKTKLRCGNNSRVKSVKSCGEVETTGKHAPRKKSVSEGRSMEALRKTARFQAGDEGGVRGGTRPQGQERNGQQQRRAREGGAKVVKRNGKGHPTRGAETRGQGENDNGTRRFQLPETTSMGENTGTEDPRPIAAPCAREMSSDVRVDVELAALVFSVETTLCSNSLRSVPRTARASRKGYPTSTHRVHHGKLR